MNSPQKQKFDFVQFSKFNFAKEETMSTATITREATPVNEISLDNPKQGFIKFYKAEKTFGFIETNDWDAFFGPHGYRRVRLLSNGKAILETAPCPTDSLEAGLEVVILSARCAPKGVHAVEWTIPSLIVEECVIWVVIQRIEQTTERESTSDPICDNERRMFKTHTTRTIDKFVNERVARTCATKEEAEKFMELHSPVYRGGFVRASGTNVTYRVESIRIA